MHSLSHRATLLCRAAAAMLLPLLAWSCQLMKDDYDESECDGDATNQYINITLSVSSSPAITRANPNGGEEGDGREQGIATRENEVEGVTLIFYRNEAGINAPALSAEDTPIDFAVYYPTTPDPTPRLADRYPQEIYYTTGDQELDTGFDLATRYHLLVVANADLTADITTGNAGKTSLATVRDMVTATVYNGSGVGSSATKFVMTSEEDYTLTVSRVTFDQALNRRTFHFDNIHIERMAARIDFWANGAEYSTAYEQPGYVYDMGGTGEKFVLTAVTPFNLNGGNEYLFKRTLDAGSPYLADETTANWVADPYTTGKTGQAHPGYQQSTLTSVIGSTGGAYRVSMADQQDSKTTIGFYDNIIVGYPKENTVEAYTPIFYHATGLAFEGYYYLSNRKTGGERRVYYHFLRHQGESSQAYQALQAADLDSYRSATITTLGGPAMNYGVVRNNIYRISVEGITPEAGWLQLRMAVHDWRNVQHPRIYI